MLKNKSETGELDRTRLPCLRMIEKGKLVTKVRKVNGLLIKIESKGVTKYNDLFYLGSALVNKVFKKDEVKDEKKQPWCKRNSESQVKKLNKDLGGLN